MGMHQQVGFPLSPFKSCSLPKRNKDFLLGNNHSGSTPSKPLIPTAGSSPGRLFALRRGVLPSLALLQQTKLKTRFMPILDQFILFSFSFTFSVNDIIMTVIMFYKQGLLSHLFKQSEYSVLVIIIIISACRNSSETVLLAVSLLLPNKA